VSSVLVYSKALDGMLLITAMLSPTSSEKVKDATSLTKSAATSPYSMNSVLVAAEDAHQPAEVVENAPAILRLMDANISTPIMIMIAKTQMEQITLDLPA